MEPTNKEVYRIGLMDPSRVLFRIGPRRALKTRRCFGFDALIDPAFCSESCSKSDPNVLFSFFYTMLLSAHVERVSVSRMRDFKYKF